MKGRRGAVAAVVEASGGQVLARATLAAEQHGGGRTRRDLLQQGLHRLHRWRLPDDAVEGERLGLERPQLPDLAAQPGGLQRPLHERHHLVHLEGLDDVVEGAPFDGLHRVLDGGVGGHEDDHGVGVGLLDAVKQLQPVDVGQSEVEEDQVHARGDPFERRGAVGRLGHVVALLLEPGAERPPDEIFVVDDEHRGRVHGGYLSARGWPASATPHRRPGSRPRGEAQAGGRGERVDPRAPRGWPLPAFRARRASRGPR